ncbi:hypothetical protein [Anatilimnocola floriformis]|uniref:hypothetical protein n=1 Tax=Anatilimnocola floriformis TaxID=2948575 RepID=UPI0020C3438E|nr:hypothetical protein [Anatilimnocola floriformis]
MVFSFQRRATSPSSLVTTLLPVLEITQEEEWIADGIDDAETVRNLAFQMSPAAIPTTQLILYRRGVTLSRQGHALYYVTVHYTPRDRTKWTWDFDTSGGTFNIKTSRQHMGSYVQPGETAKDHKGAIGRQLDGSVDGADIVIRSMKFNVTCVQPLGVVTIAYAMHIHELTGCVNSKPMFGRPPGEVLFLGGRGSDGTETEASVGCMFAIEKNLQNKLIGGINVVQKDGHDYAWVEFKNDTDGDSPVTVPVQIDVCRVYDRVDLAAELGFGG